MKIDAHQHFWRIGEGFCRWLKPEMTAIYRDYQPAGLAPLLKRHGVGKTVLVQAADCAAETEALLQTAAGCDFVAAVVGWVNLQSAAAGAQIEALAARAKFRGVRPMIQDIEDDDWMLGAQLDPAYQALCECGLAFDALVFPRHLDNLHTLCSRYPDLRVVIDHGAKPAIGRGLAAFHSWAAGMRRMAAHEGVYCKVSGLLTEAAPGATAADLRPYADVLLEHFGAHRLLWGSDWPVVNLAGGYDNWAAITAELLAPLPPPARAAILGQNARDFYRIA